MGQLRLPHLTRSRPELRYVRAPEPIHFPEEAEVRESKTHLEVRTFLYKLLQFALGPEHSVGSEQFVYWNAADNTKSLAPDVFVKLGVPDAHFGSWKTWERGGAPDLAVEIVSPLDREREPQWEEKLSRYHELGVGEVVRFDAEQPEGSRLRVWDRVEGDLLERVLAGDRTPCLTLGLAWSVQPIPVRAGDILGLRFVDDEGRLLETREEKAETLRRAEAEARAAAEARVRELEEELRRRAR